MQATDPLSLSFFPPYFSSLSARPLSLIYQSLNDGVNDDESKDNGGEVCDDDAGGITDGAGIVDDDDIAICDNIDDAEGDNESRNK